MAKEKNKKTENKKEQTKETPNNAPEQVQMNIIAQYLKDMSFESPNAPDIFQNQAPINMNMEINININKHEKVKDLFESCLMVRVTSMQEKAIAFIIELEYAALVQIKSENEQLVKSVLSKDVPQLLYPYIRQIISNISVQGGFPAANLAAINFSHHANLKQDKK